tara:strand:+ start:14170 stop:14280 length:111 start_codon:yes stop_codon:yes gene_type:complete
MKERKMSLSLFFRNIKSNDAIIDIINRGSVCPNPEI